MKKEQVDLVITLEVGEVAKDAIELTNIKKSISKNHKKLKELQQTLTNSGERLKELTKTIISRHRKIVMLKQSKKVVSAKSNDDKDYECPVCLQVPLPPLMVYQCLEGHIYCSDCKKKLEKCPQCRQHIKSLNIRNRMVEKMIEKIFLS